MNNTGAQIHQARHAIRTTSAATVSESNGNSEREFVSITGSNSHRNFKNIPSFSTRMSLASKNDRIRHGVGGIRHGLDGDNVESSSRAAHATRRPQSTPRTSNLWNSRTKSMKHSNQILHPYRINNPRPSTKRPRHSKPKPAIRPLSKPKPQFYPAISRKPKPHGNPHNSSSNSSPANPTSDAPATPVYTPPPLVTVRSTTATSVNIWSTLPPPIYETVPVPVLCPPTYHDSIAPSNQPVRLPVAYDLKLVPLIKPKFNKSTTAYPYIPDCRTDGVSTIQ